MSILGWKQRWVVAMAAAWAGWVVGAVNAEERLVEPGVYQVGTIGTDLIRESSGVVRSRSHDGVFWTHNDGGGRRSGALYAIDRAGKLLAVCPLQGMDLSDWEDIAIDSAGNLYVGDFGNNDLDRTEVSVHRVREPDPKTPGTVEAAQTWRLTFPEKPFNCESLVIWDGWGYMISKVTDDERAELFRFSLRGNEAGQVVESVGRLSITSPVTGADVSEDGMFLGVVAKAGAYLFRVDGDVGGAVSVSPRRVKFKAGQIEGCCFVPEGLLATSELREIFLFTGLAD